MCAPRLIAAIAATSLASCTPDQVDGGEDASVGDAGAGADAAADAAADAGWDVGSDAARADLGAPDGQAADSGAMNADSGEPIPISPNTSGWWREITAYEVFIRSFADSNGDGVSDLPGLTARLDHLNDGVPGVGPDLEVGAVWLMPFHPTASYHGYDVTNHREVNPAYGTLADLDTFVAAAHQRGVRVIMDLVLNHTSSAHAWFQDSRTGPEALKRDWYVWRADNPPWRRPWDGRPVWHAAGGAYYYGIFSSGMPDLNLANPQVEAEMREVMRFWLARGIDGFRIDAARYLIEGGESSLAEDPQTHALIKRLRAELHADHPEALFLAEAWTATNLVAQYYGRANEYQLAFSFDLAEAIKASVNTASAAPLIDQLTLAASVYEDRGFEAPFLSNHDQTRAMRLLGGDAARARLTAALLFAMPGTPFLYYGEELGMQGGATPRDEDKRTPMRWDPTGPGHGFTSAGMSWYGPSVEAAGVDVATQSADPGSLLSLYRRLVRLRTDEPRLARGDAGLLEHAAGAGVVALVREYDGRRLVFAANLGEAAVPSFALGVPGTPRSLYAEGLVGTSSGTPGKLTIDGLEPRSFAFIALD